MTATLPESCGSDPNRPLVDSKKKYPTKEERTGVAMIESVQTKMCSRKFNAEHMGDTASDGNQHPASFLHFVLMI